jgi:hypothetical protein
MFPLGAILDIGSKILDKVFPDPAAAEAAKLKLLEMQQNQKMFFTLVLAIKMSNYMLTLYQKQVVRRVILILLNFTASSNRQIQSLY